MTLPDRKYSSGKGYRFGFGGQEKDSEVVGEGNSYTAPYWQYDPRIGRRWNVDPIMIAKESVYAVFRNNPVLYNDPNGDCPDCRDYKYSIKAGDTFWELENKWGLKHGILQKANPELDPKKLQIGQVIIAPKLVETDMGSWVQYPDTYNVDSSNSNNLDWPDYGPNEREQYIHDALIWLDPFVDVVGLTDVDDYQVYATGNHINGEDASNLDKGLMFVGQALPVVSGNGLRKAGNAIADGVNKGRKTLRGSWKRLDITNSKNWNGCDDFAKKIQKEIGGEIKTFRPKKTPFLGGYKGGTDEFVQPRWGHHTVVVKDGRVYDGFIDQGGMDIADYKKQFEAIDDIDFGF